MFNQTEISKLKKKYKIIFSVYIKNYLWKIIIAFILMILSTLLILPIPYITRNIIDKLLPQKNFHELLIYTAIILIIIIFQKVFSFIYNMILFKLNSKIILDIRKRLLEKISYLKFSVFNKYDKNYLFSRVERDPTYIHSIFGEQIITISKDVLIFLVGFVGILFISPKLTIFAIIIFPIFIYLLIFFSKKMKNIFNIFLENKAIENSRLQESLKGLKFLKKINKEVTAILRYYKYTLI